ncbi:SulP family inorganic anion transporter [Paenibacillus antarcticus]|uniref:Sodium-independent anion transporter n=1 Tax=Paenibacillus antarcticus TaxID=253703 RepID=A0A168PBI4_9BACL|nr:SulP family inorganic anion transporter [Paenibacillus antarcticus]OAB46602.1 sodium-independent anion transporter [Paenibacillus antarcticus]
MESLQLNRSTWLGNTRRDILSGMTVALALIPESIAFSIIAGVSPMVGLYASFCMAVIISIVGGRPAMISAATGAMALLMVTLVKEHGIEYLFAATILTGIIQYVMGILKIGQLISFIPHSVMNGFVNALAILVFIAQWTQFKGQSWVMYAMVALTLAIIYVLPLFTNAIPSALVAIIVVSIISITMGLNINTVGDMGAITSTLPFLHIPQVLFSIDTLLIILPYSFSLAVVGILESLLTATVLDEMTNTGSDKNKEVRGQGIANVVNGFFGGMAGCAMIGQSVINVRSGGRKRLSTLVSGVFLLFLIIVLGPIVTKIPMAALVGVMIMVCIGTFNWDSIRELNQIPRTDALVMIITVIIVVWTHNLSYGVIAGVLLSALFFAWKMGKIRSEEWIGQDGHKEYKVRGQMFFGTTTHFIGLFNYVSDPDNIKIDFSNSQIWDQSAVAGILKVIAKYEQLGKKVKIVGLNKESQIIIDKMGLPVTIDY